MNKHHILLAAYQCGPGMGSVSQIGWEWYSRLSEVNEVTLVTHIRNKVALEGALDYKKIANIIFIDTEWFAGPLYRLAQRLFPKSEHSVTLVSSLDYFIFDFVAYRQLKKLINSGLRWNILHRVTPVTFAAPTWLGHLKIPMVIGPLNSGLKDPVGFGKTMKQESTWLIKVRGIARLLDALLGSTKRAACILTASKTTLEQVNLRYRTKCQPMLENGVDLTRFTPAPWPDSPDASHPLRILFVGRLVPVKGLEMLLAAVAQLKEQGQNVVLDVVGDGPLRNDWMNLSAELGLTGEVHFHGALAMHKVALHMQSCHIFCLPSVRESGGAVLLEAMACARPVIALNFGGPVDIVSAQVGALLSMNNPEQVTADLAATLGDILKHPQAWKIRGETGRTLIENRYSWPAKISEAHNIYRKVLAERALACNSIVASKTRIAYLISRYPAVSHTFILREVQQLRNRGLDLQVASVNATDCDLKNHDSAEYTEAARTYTLKQHGFMGAIAAHVFGLRYPLNYLRGLFYAVSLAGLNPKQAAFSIFYFTEALMVARWMKSHQLNHLHVHFATAAANIGLMLKHTFPIGLSLTVHGPDEFYDTSLQWLRQKIEAADFIVCISKFARSQLMLLSAPKHWDKFEVCPLGVDTERYQPAIQTLSTSQKLNLLCVGRLTPAKGQRVLIDACNLLRNEARQFHLIIAGGGPDEEELKAAVNSYGMSECIEFSGPLNQEEVRQKYAEAHVFILPSFAEGVPVVLMEAMASGIPCITTRITGIPELIRDGVDGLLVIPSDVNALADAVARLMDEPELRSRLGNNGRQRVQEKYNLQRNTSLLADLFEQRIEATS